MKTLPILGGLLTAGFVAAVGVGIYAFPTIVGLALVGLCSLALMGLFFYLGYTFTRDVILGGRGPL